MGGNGYRHKGSAVEEAGAVRSGLVDLNQGKRSQISELASKETIAALRPEFRAWGQSLDQYQKEALRSYINDGYKEMNSYLRGGGKMTAEDAPLELQDLQDAILKGRLNQSVTVYRGSSRDLNPFAAQAMMGAQGFEKGFTSTSLDFKTAFQFTGPAEPGKFHVVREITLPKGSRAGMVGGTEKELILPAGSRFQHIGMQTATYTDSVTGEQERVLIQKLMYLGPKGMRGRPRVGKKNLKP